MFGMEVRDFSIEEIGRDVARLRIGFVNLYFVGAPAASGQPALRPWALVDAGLADRRRADSQRRGRSVWRELTACRHRVDPRPLRSRRGARRAPACLGRPGLRPHARVTFPDRPCRLSTTRPDRWRRTDVASRAAVPRARDRPGRSGSARCPRTARCPACLAGNGSTRLGMRRGTSRCSARPIASLLAGDAVTTTKQESVFSVSTQKQELNGPPS